MCAQMRADVGACAHMRPYSYSYSNSNSLSNATVVDPVSPDKPPEEVSQHQVNERNLRRWIGEHKNLLFTPRLFGKLLEIWNHPAGGKERVDECVSTAIKAGISDVGAYALTVFTNRIAKLAESSPPPRPILSGLKLSKF